MGYRSQVGMALSKSALDTMNRKLEMADGPTRSAVKDFLDSADIYKHSEDGSEGYIWDLIKWYDEEPEVKFFDAFFSEIDCSAYLFVLVGEDADDGENRGCFFNNPFGLHLVRKVEMNK